MDMEDMEGIEVMDNNNMKRGSATNLLAHENKMKRSQTVNLGHLNMNNRNSSNQVPTSDV